MTVNRQWRLARRPSGMVQSSDFTWTEEPVPSVGEGQTLVRNLYLSMDPTQRGWMSRDTYIPAIAIGDVIRSFGVGQVVLAECRFRVREKVDLRLGHVQGQKRRLPVLEEVRRRRKLGQDRGVGRGRLEGRATLNDDVAQPQGE